MTKNEALHEIKSRLKALFSSEEVEIKMYQCTTTDGTTLETDGENLEVGAMIYKIDENGNRVPAEDGSYPTSDYTIEVKDGAVVAITEQMEEGPEMENPEAPVAAETSLVIEPKADESQSDFVSRCVIHQMDAGMEQTQAVAACYGMWENSNMSSETKMNSEPQSGPNDMPRFAEQLANQKMADLESKVTEMSNMVSSLIEITEKLNEKIINLSNQPAVTPVILEKNLTPAELRVERLKQLAKNK